MAGKFDPIDRCPDCGWTFGGFHLCTKFEGPEPTPKFVPEGRRFDGTFTEEVREKISEANKRRWDEYRAGNSKRDQKIVARYAEGGIGMVPLSKEFGVGRQTVRAVLLRAQDAGVITIRKQGATVAKGA